MAIRLNTPPVRSGIRAQRTRLAGLRVLVAALIAAALGLHGGLSRWAIDHHLSRHFPRGALS